MTLIGNQDHSSVFYIHPSDASTTQLVSVKFNGTGFHNWKRSMMLTLSAKNKLGFVNGSVTEPGLLSPEYKCWQRCNDLVISWIIFNLEETIAKSVLFMQSAKEIWNDLEERYVYASVAQIYSLEQQLSEISQGQDSISEFFTKIKTVWDGLNDANPLPCCTCNLNQKLQQRQQDQRLLQFMMKLSEQFSAVRGNVLMMQPLPNVSQAYRLFAQEERHKEISQLSTQIEAMALYYDKRRFSHNTQFPKSATGNYRNNTGNSTTVANTNYKRNTKPHYFCSHCNVPGHNIGRCFKIHGFPPGFQARQNMKVAAAVHHSDNVDSDNTAFYSTNTPGEDGSHILTKEQYAHFMNLFQQQSTPKVDNNAASTSKHALLAGPCSEQASGSSW